MINQFQLYSANVTSWYCPLYIKSLPSIGSCAALTHLNLCLFRLRQLGVFKVPLGASMGVLAEQALKHSNIDMEVTNR